MTSTNSPREQPVLVYRYMFWGLPTGSSILPRLAATVCSTTTKASRSCRPVRHRISTVKGTKVMSATSLVMSMAEKKHSSTNIISNWRVVRASLSNRSPKVRNSPRRRQAAITPISANSSPNVCRSMYPP